MLPRKDLSSPSEQKLSPASRRTFPAVGAGTTSKVNPSTVDARNAGSRSRHRFTPRSIWRPSTEKDSPGHAGSRLLPSIALPLTASIWAIESTVFWGDHDHNADGSTQTGPSSCHSRFSCSTLIAADGRGLRCVIAVVLARPNMRGCHSSIDFESRRCSIAVCVVRGGRPLLLLASSISLRLPEPARPLVAPRDRHDSNGRPHSPSPLATTHVLARIGRRGLAYRDAWNGDSDHRPAA